jgi:hypothetical protein
MIAAATSCCPRPVSDRTTSPAKNLVTAMSAPVQLKKKRTFSYLADTAKPFKSRQKLPYY